jgi:di/tripeptidase
VPVVEGQRTTYNGGLISGGTSVNTIAQNAEFLYEYRSTDRHCLSTMKDAFEKIVAAHRSDEVKIGVELVGERPCSGDVDPAREAALEAMVDEACRSVFGKGIEFGAASTDANIPLSQGIPALTIGAVVAPGAHTREEHLEKSSLVPGLSFLLHFFNGLFNFAG